MEKAASKEEKARILKRIEAIGNRDVDGLDAPQNLLRYLRLGDAEIINAALQASGAFVSNQELFEQVLQLASTHAEEEVRSMASSCLGNVICDGLEFEDDLPEGAEVPAASVNPEFYQSVKDFLFSRVDSLMESMDVRRRVLEAIGYLGFKPEVRELILRFYRQAPNPWVKVSALYAMGLTRDPVFERLILEELYNGNPDVLVEAMHASHILGLSAAEKRLVELSRHPNLDVRCEAVVALGYVGNPEIMPGLLQRVEIENHGVSDVADALAHSRIALRQRHMSKSGDPLWDDAEVMGEIEDLLDNREPGS